jgi:putative ABC transport system permease protein
MRIALGASRTRLSRQLLTESLMLSAAGGVLGVGVAIVAISALRVLDLPVMRLHEISVDHRVLVLTAGVSMLAGLLFSMAPAWHIGRWNLQGRLRESGPSHSAGAERRAIQSLLSVAQVAIALIRSPVQA